MFVAVLAHQSAKVLLFGGMTSGCKLVNTWVQLRLNYHQLEDIPAVVRETGVGCRCGDWATGVCSLENCDRLCASGATVNLFGGCPQDTSITVNTEQLHTGINPKAYSQQPGLYAPRCHWSRVISFELLVVNTALKDLEQSVSRYEECKVIKSITPLLT